jgi:hypothetical protein
VFSVSFEQRTENPRVENSVITPINMHPERSALIGAFLCLRFCVEGDIPVFFLPYITGNGWKSMLTLLVFYFCQPYGKFSKYMAYNDLVINRNRLLATFTVCFAPWGNYITC